MLVGKAFTHLKIAKLEPVLSHGVCFQHSETVVDGIIILYVPTAHTISYAKQQCKTSDD